MKRAAAELFVLALGALLLTAAISEHRSAVSEHRAFATEHKLLLTATMAKCVYRAAGSLPDPSCTPGAINHAVTQKTIASTICRKGWTATVRPPVNVTEPEKIVAIRQYGFAFGTSPRGYEFDHLIPLELGGATNDPRNLWPEPHAGAHGSFVKDGVENHLNALVCSGKLRLAAARRTIRTDWRAAP